MSAKQKKHRPLTVRGHWFIAEFLVDGNAAAAVRRAGYKASNADQQAGDFVRHGSVRL